MSIDTLINIGALAAGSIGLGSGARARVKASRQVATQEVWREEAEAQKARGDREEARGDRLEKAVEELTAEVHSLRAGIKRLTNVLRAIAPELAEGEMDDDS